MERIVIGSSQNTPMFVFENADIQSCNCIMSSSLSGNQLAIDEFYPVVYSAAYIRVPFIPSGSSSLMTSDGKQFFVYPGGGFLDKVPYGTPVWYYSSGSLVGKFYTTRVTRTGKMSFDILAVSGIGIMEGQQHLGGVYTGQTFEDVADEIIGNAYPFTCAPELSSLLVYGWLPIDTKRNNLHQLLFATGVMLDKDGSGNIYFRYPNADTQTNVPDNRIFIGGSVDYLSPASQADITEHAYISLATDQTETLFDNSDGLSPANNVFVSFRNAPIYDLATTGTLTIERSGVNYAVVSGVGTLTGKPYTHVTKVVSRKAVGGAAEKVVSVADATLVSVANSENVAKRVISYYNSAKTISADIYLAGEKPGDLIAFNDPYGDPSAAFIESMSTRAGSFVRASCDLVTNYVPVGQGNNYTRAIVLTGSGSFSWPANTSTAFVVLIGGGDGGASGGHGTRADNSLAIDYNPIPGVGGVGGAKGNGGRIYTVKLQNPSGSVEYECGVGGAGGVATIENASNAGQSGTDTTFAQYTTADGLTSATGYVNLFSGEVFGVPGLDGVKGGDGSSTGGEGDSVIFGGEVWTCGQTGASAENADEDYGLGGFGGGAAVGSNGGDGTDARTTSSAGYGGDGGDGASPYNGADGATYGCGGSGGHGGGGGGPGGYGSGNDSRLFNGSPGSGAEGSNGGAGIDGCIIIYL